MFMFDVNHLQGTYFEVDFSDDEISRQLIHLRHMMEMNQYVQALELSAEVLANVRAKNDFYYLCVTLRLVGNIYSSLSRYSEAIKFQSESLAYARLSGKFPIDSAAPLYNIGMCLFKTGNYESALEYYYRALAIAEQHDTVGRLTGTILNGVAEILRVMREYDLAIEDFQRAIEYNKKSGNIRSLAYSVMNLGNCYLDIKEYDKSLKFLNEAYEIQEKIQNFYGLASVLSNIGAAYGQLGKYEQCIDYSQRAMEIYNKISISSDAISTLTNLSEAHLLLGKHEEALAPLVQAEKILSNTQARHFEHLIYTAYQKYYEHIGDYKQAYEFSKKAISFSRNTFSKELAERMSAMQALHEVEQHKAKLQVHQLKNVELAQANKKLTEISAEKDEILSVVAHDLKNPISNISLLARLAKTEQDDKERDELLQQISKQTERMSQLIHDLLSVKELERHSQSLTLQPVNLSLIVLAEITNLLNTATEKSITFHRFLADDSLIVLGEDKSLLHCISNLLSNAVKYSPYHGNVSVGTFSRETSEIQLAEWLDETEILSVREQLPTGKYGIFAVKDQGQGLSADDLSKLFGRFQRLSARPTGGESSTGLGLSIVKRYCDLMNGKVWCTSVYGNGATFFFALPLAEESNIE